MLEPGLLQDRFRNVLCWYQAKEESVMKQLTVGKIGLALARGALLTIELAANAVGTLFGGSGARADRGNPLFGRVRTAAGIEPVAYDEDGKRIGARSGLPAIGDA